MLTSNWSRAEANRVLRRTRPDEEWMPHEPENDGETAGMNIIRSNFRIYNKILIVIRNTKINIQRSLVQSNDLSAHGWRPLVGVVCALSVPIADLF
jgi:hypothetical protein